MCWLGHPPSHMSTCVCVHVSKVQKGTARHGISRSSLPFSAKFYSIALGVNQPPESRMPSLCFVVLSDMPCFAVLRPTVLLSLDSFRCEATAKKTKKPKQDKHKARQQQNARQSPKIRPPEKQDQKTRPEAGMSLKSREL